MHVTKSHWPWSIAVCIVSVVAPLIVSVIIVGSPEGWHLFGLLLCDSFGKLAHCGFKSISDVVDIAGAVGSCIFTPRLLGPEEVMLHIFICFVCLVLHCHSRTSMG